MLILTQGEFQSTLVIKAKVIIMLKFIIPAIVIFLIVLFWEKINEIIYRKFNIKINYIATIIFLIVLGIIFSLLYF